MTSLARLVVIASLPVILIWLAYHLTADRFGHFCASVAVFAMPLLWWAANWGCPT